MRCFAMTLSRLLLSTVARAPPLGAQAAPAAPSSSKVSAAFGNTVPTIDPDDRSRTI